MTSWNDKPTVSPVLRYTDGPAAIDFLVNALGFQKQSDHRTPDGAVGHADLAFRTERRGRQLRERVVARRQPLGARPPGLYIVVADPDALLSSGAVAAGADVATPIADQSYGSRDFTLRDPEGHLWGFGTYDMSRGERRADHLSRDSLSRCAGAASVDRERARVSQNA